MQGKNLPEWPNYLRWALRKFDSAHWMVKWCKGVRDVGKYDLGNTPINFLGMAGMKNGGMVQMSIVLGALKKYTTIIMVYWRHIKMNWKSIAGIFYRKRKVKWIKVEIIFLIAPIMLSSPYSTSLQKQNIFARIVWNSYHYDWQTYRFYHFCKEGYETLILKSTLTSHAERAVLSPASYPTKHIQMSPS